MNDWLDIGSSPPDETCAQIGSPDYHDRARVECRVYINLLRRIYGPEPDGARLCIRRNAHDFGTNLSVACCYESGNQQAIDYALLCDSGKPSEWDAQAKTELGNYYKEIEDG